MFRPQREILIGFGLICVLSLGLMSSNWLRSIDRALYDVELRWLRARAPSVLAQDVVVIGLDEEAFESIREPYALWHRQLGQLLSGLAQARPAVVGLATPLPVRSYEFLVKGIDAPLIEGARALRAVAPLILGQSQGIGQKLRPIVPELVAAAGPGAVASLVICEDMDGVVRRLNQQRCIDEDKKAPFAHAMAKELGREGTARGLIDYSAGAEIEYIPLKTALAWLEEGKQDSLTQRVQGRAVVVAGLLPTETRHRLPVALTAWERGSRIQPGVVAHVQALRSMLGRGLIESVSPVTSLSLAAMAALLWFGRNGRGKVLALLVATGAMLAGSVFALWHGYYLHVGTLLAVMLLAFVARLAWESVRHYREKQLLRTAFAGHVSPRVMRAILRGRLQPEGEGERCKVTILFTDIRGFTARSERATPEAMIALLNRYYAHAAAAIHARGGAIDKFMGDGLMATFGVPQPLTSPERNALEAAQDLLVRLARLNGELKAEGVEPLEIGVGIHSGEVLAGYVGTTKRRDYTVIGDAVNTASRLEGLSKTVGYPIVCSQDVAAAVGFCADMVDLGSQPIKGRSDMHLWGWKPPLVQRVGKGRA
jgi:adenylate cyclase